MIRLKQTIFIGVWLFFLGLSAWLATGKTNVQAGPESVAHSSPLDLQPPTLLFAENSTNAKQQEQSGSTRDQESKPKSETETAKEASPSQDKEAPRRPFVPSEKVKADQAVDFPYDI